MTKFVGVVCAKGGVGRTTVTINLAQALENVGYEVLILDCDFTSPNIPLFLGLINSKQTIHRVLKDEAQVSEVINNHISGIQAIPGSINYEDATIHHVDLLEKVFCKIEDYDVVLVDTPAGFHPNSQQIMDLMDDLIFVTAPELTAVTDCLRTIKHAQNNNKNILGVVVNKFRDDALDMTLGAIESFLSQKIIGVIPHDHNVRNAVYLKQPVTYAYPESDAAQGFTRLAYNLAGKKYVEEVPLAPVDDIEKMNVFKFVVKRTLKDFGLI